MRVDRRREVERRIKAVNGKMEGEAHQGDLWVSKEEGTERNSEWQIN